MTVLHVYAFFRWIVLSCEAGMHIASFQDGNVPLPDLEYAKGRSLTTTLLLLHNCYLLLLSWLKRLLSF